MGVLTLAIVAGAAVLVVITLWLMLFGNHPWKGNTTEPRAVKRSDDRARTADRPAGPGAETMDPDRLGGDHSPPAQS